jgi:protein-tyrosine phosphatase
MSFEFRADGPRRAGAMIGSVLMICTGNLCRSPIAEALLKAAAAQSGRRLEVASAGIAALEGEPAAADAVALLAGRGLDIGAHRARQVTLPMARRHDLILVMEAAQKSFMEENWPLLRGRVHRLCVDEDIVDPYRLPRQVFEESLAQIEVGLDDWIRKLWG